MSSTSCRGSVTLLCWGEALQVANFHCGHQHQWGMRIIIFIAPCRAPNGIKLSGPWGKGVIRRNTASSPVLKDTLNSNNYFICSSCASITREADSGDSDLSWHSSVCAYSQLGLKILLLAQRSACEWLFLLTFTSCSVGLKGWCSTKWPWVPCRAGDGRMDGLRAQHSWLWAPVFLV